MSGPAFDLHWLVRALGGEITGCQVLAPGPGHSHRDRSLSVRLDPGAPAGFVVHSFAGDDPIVCRDHVRRALGFGDWQPTGLTLSRRTTPFVVPKQLHQADTPPLSTAEHGPAACLWEEATDPADSPVERYFVRRCVSMPLGAAGRAVRWHPQCPFGPGRRVGCMLALVTDIVTDQPLGIQRTALDQNGRKLSELGSNGRLSLGPIGGGAVKLTADEDVGLSIAVGEGLESTLSLRNLDSCAELAVWPLLSTSQVRNFPVLPGIETLWVAVDHDPAGIMAARQVAARWQKAGREVVLIAPRAKGDDLNDAVVCHA